jgi:hypothetical protein
VTQTKKRATRTTKVNKVLVILHAEGGTVYWRVRMIAPYLPFRIDSGFFMEKEAAERTAAKWRKREVQITFAK